MVPAGDRDVCTAAVEAALFPKIVDKPATRVALLARKAVAEADPAATMNQARADTLVDLVLANVSVTTVVDLALPAGFAPDIPSRAGSCGACGQGLVSGADRSRAGGSAGAGRGTGGSVLEDRAIGALVDADQDRDRDIKGAADHDANHDADHDAGRSNVFRLLTGLPTAGVLDHRVGSLTPATIERILADPDTVFRRLLVDPDTGWVLDVGATTYQPGRHLARTVRKRDLCCRFPGCATAARFCDLDHVIPFPIGLTLLHNLACLCRRHHRLKTHGHWSLTMSPDGVAPGSTSAPVRSIPPNPPTTASSPSEESLWQDSLLSHVGVS